MRRVLSALMGFTLAIILIVPTAYADDAGKAQSVVDKAHGALQSFAADPEMIWFRDNVHNAKGIFIVPTMVKAGFMFGGSGGSGALLARGDLPQGWSYPAFYTMGSVTFGLQIGGEVSEIMFLVMTERGMDAFLSSEFKVGGDVSVAVGPVGAGLKAQTADILAFSRSKGVYGGLNIEGAVFKIRNDWNQAYYGPNTRPTDIFVTRSVSNRGAEVLRAAVGQVVQ